MKRSIIILGLTLAALLPAAAQNHVTLSYSIAFPLGDLGDFISPMSWRGVALDYHAMLDDNVGLGFSTAWNVFYEELDRDTYEQGTQSLTGKQYRYSNHVPLLFSGAYYLQPNEPMNPFVSMGLGTMYSRRTTDMGQFEIEEDAWGFALAPELGAIFYMENGYGISASLQYYHAFASGELDSGQSYLGLKIGFEL